MIFEKNGVASMHDGLRISGSDRLELGRSAAAVSGRTVIPLIRLLSRWLKSSTAAKQRADRYHRLIRRTLYRQFPETARELEGAARGLSLHPEDLLYARVALQNLFPTGCTNFGAVPPATDDDSIMISWNFDIVFLFKLIMGRFPLFVREVEGTIPYLCVGTPVLWDIGILNSEGLCCVNNAVGMTDAGGGFHPFELIGRAMETCSTVREAAGVFDEGPRMATRCMFIGMLMNSNTIWADRDGSLSVFEYSHNHFHEEPAGPQGIIASANHHQFLDNRLSGSFDPDSQEFIAGSYSRLGRMWNLLREYHGRINPQVAKTMTSDHIPDYTLLKDFGIARRWWEEKLDDSTICAHAWNFGKHLRRGEFGRAFDEISASCTLYSFQIQPLSHTVWLTNGFPCRNPAVPTYWGRILGAGGEPPQSVPVHAEPGRPRRYREHSGIFRHDAGPLESGLRKVWLDIIEMAERPNFSDRL